MTNGRVVNWDRVAKTKGHFLLTPLHISVVSSFCELIKVTGTTGETKLGRDYLSCVPPSLYLPLILCLFPFMLQTRG